MSEPMRSALLKAGVGLGLLGILAYLVTCRLPGPSFIGLALVWSGGASNLIDRLTRHGVVSDFIFIQVGPLHTGIFNVADVMVVTGIALLAFGLLKRGDKRSQERPS